MTNKGKKNRKGRNVSRKEAAYLLQQLNAEVDDHLAGQFFDGVTAYRLSDGSELIVLGDGSGVLWFSRDELLRMWKETSEETPRHLLSGRLLFGDVFPSHATDLARSLADHLKIDPSILDGSLDSLESIDRQIRKVGWGKFLQAPDKFSSLVAYLGNAVIRHFGGEWQMKLGLDGVTWEPWIIMHGQRPFAPFLIVYRALSEPRGSIRGATQGSVGPWDSTHPT